MKIFEYCSVFPGFSEYGVYHETARNRSATFVKTERNSQIAAGATLPFGSILLRSSPLFACEQHATAGVATAGGRDRDLRIWLGDLARTAISA